MSDRTDAVQNYVRNVTGIPNIYFQPPSTVKMKYPAAIISISDIENTFANGAVYQQNTSYMVTLIDRDPDSEYKYKLMNEPLCSFIRHYEYENLNHDVFKLYH